MASLGLIPLDPVQEDSVATGDDTYLRAIVARKWWVLGVTLAAGLMAGIYSLTLEDQYRASARLLVLEPSVESKTGGYYNVTTTVYSVDTYSSMLGNQEMLASVVRDMALDFPPDRLTPHKLRARLSVIPVKDTKLIEIGLVYWNPVKAKHIVNEVARRFVQLYWDLRSSEIEASQSFIKQQLDRAQQNFEQVHDSLKAARLSGKVDRLQLRLQHLLDELKMFETDLEATRADVARAQARLDELEAMLASMPEEMVSAVREAVSTVTGSFPPDSAAVVKRAWDLLAQWDVSPLVHQAASAQQRSSLERADAKVQEMRQALSELLNPPGRRRLTPQEWGERYRVVSEGLADLATTLQELPGGDLASPSALQPLRRQLADLAAVASGGLAQSTREEVRGVNPLRESLLRDRAETQVALRGYRAKESQLAQVVANLKAEIRSVEDQLYRGMREVEALEEEAKVAANLKSMLAEKYDHSRIEVAAKLGTMTLVDPALVPEKRIGPQRKLNVLMGMLLGFTLASVAVVAREAVSR